VDAGSRERKRVKIDSGQGDHGMSFDVDLFVIGGGSGGVRAARIAAATARASCLRRVRMGGTCVIRGCVRKKLLVYASHTHHEIEDAAGFGWTIPSATFDWRPSLQQDKEIARLEAAYAAMWRNPAPASSRRARCSRTAYLRLATARGEGKICSDRRPAARQIRACIPGIEHVISSNEVFHLTRCRSAS